MESIATQILYDVRDHVFWCSFFGKSVSCCCVCMTVWCVCASVHVCLCVCVCVCVALYIQCAAISVCCDGIYVYL